MYNILTAIKAIIENLSDINDISYQSRTLNRANQAGDALENYVKNAFANCIGKDDSSVKKARNNCFSYLGNNSNPPDAILKGSDAIEIKKLISIGTQHLQLNSSYPKQKLYSDNPKICRACRECEIWDVKDMLYVVGAVNGNSLQNLFFVYGDLYCDSNEIYEKAENVIKYGLESLEGVEFAETNELGRVNKIDHLGISDLRVRGMWLIKSPFVHFKELTHKVENYTFQLDALIPQNKYDSFPNKTFFEDFCNSNNVDISDIDLEDPRNPAKTIPSKLITFILK